MFISNMLSVQPTLTEVIQHSTTFFW